LIRRVGSRRSAGSPILWSRSRTSREWESKKDCRPRRGGSHWDHLVGCINGRPVDSPSAAQPSGTVVCHSTTSFRKRNPSRRDHCEIAARLLSPRPSPGNDGEIVAASPGSLTSRFGRGSVSLAIVSASAAVALAFRHCGPLSCLRRRDSRPGRPSSGPYSP
jgi:hypothetical protein